VDCWLLLPESLCEKCHTPGGVALQTLLTGPAVVGEIVLFPFILFPLLFMAP